MRLHLGFKSYVLALAAISGMIVPRTEAEQCNNSDLNGSYSFVASGTFAGASFAAAGQGIYDGKGNVSGVIQASVGGTVKSAASWTGTYSLSAMQAGDGQTVCVLTKTITIDDYGPLTVSFFGTAGDGYKELRFIATGSNATNSLTISGSARKQYPPESSNR
jgi:hypothetical protein